MLLTYQSRVVSQPSPAGRLGPLASLAIIAILIPGTQLAWAQEAKPPLASLAKPSAVAGESAPKTAGPAVTLPARPEMARTTAIPVSMPTVQPVAPPSPPRVNPPSVQPPRVSPPRVGR
jgi:hypothetical protein